MCFIFKHLQRQWDVLHRVSQHGNSRKLWNTHKFGMLDMRLYGKSMATRPILSTLPLTMKTGIISRVSSVQSFHVFFYVQFWYNIIRKTARLGRWMERYKMPTLLGKYYSWDYSKRKFSVLSSIHYGYYDYLLYSSWFLPTYIFINYWRIDTFLKWIV